MARWFFVTCLLINLVLFIDSSKILVVVPFPAISHQVVFWPLTQELARRGHQVTFVTTHPAFPKGQSPANLTEIDLHELSLRIWQEGMRNLKRGDKSSHIAVLNAFTPVLYKAFEAQVNSSEFQKILIENEYDLLILEGVIRPVLALSHVFKAPVILMNSLGGMKMNFQQIGAPTHPLLYPTPFHERLYNLTMWEKINELWNHYHYELVNDLRIPEENKLIKKLFGKDTPPISELQNNVDMLFLNMHPIFEGNIPVPPGVQSIWGINKKPRKDLPTDLKTYLDSSKNGVIYMSFGTNVDPTSLPQEKLQMFVRVFSKLPYDVLWKWNGDVLPGKPDNVRIGKWFPQSDLLRHPKIKLFITQGGLQSTDEAIQARIPLVAVPMLVDQWYNAEKYVHLGIGVKLDWDTITEDAIRDAINTVAGNISYKRNMEKIDTLMHDEPMDGLQRAVWWTEYVLRHKGARHLRSPAANISWAEYLELELVSVVLLTLGVFSFIIIFIIYKIFKVLSQFFSFIKIKVKVH